MEYIEELKTKFSEQFGRTAQEYLTMGLDLFHRYREKETEFAQAAVGNMIVGTELLIKSFLAHRNLSNIFSSMPQEVRMFLANPDKVPRFFKWRNVAVDVHSDLVTPLNFDESADSFYVFFPHMKQLILPYAAILSRLRQASLHSIIPMLNSYELGRVGYAVLTIAETINNEDSFPYKWYKITENDTLFLRRFEEDRVERVKLALTRAKQTAREGIGESFHAVVALDWRTYEAICPVCRASGLLNGYTELAIAEDDHGPYPTLDFFAVSFRCDDCRLTLHDCEEIKLAGMNSLYDRSGDIDKWFRDHGDPAHWNYDMDSQ